MNKGASRVNLKGKKKVEKRQQMMGIDGNQGGCPMSWQKWGECA